MQHQLPLGFRFKPTDEELLVEYLPKKVLGQQLPSYAVIEGEVDGDEAQIREGIASAGEKFIFAKRKKKNQEGTKMNRLAKDGFWKVTGNKKDIFDKSRKRIGVKRSLVFKPNSNHGRYKNKSLLMDEYQLVKSMIPNNNEVEWAICRIKESNRSPEIDVRSPEIVVTTISDMDEIFDLVDRSPVDTASGTSHLPCETQIYQPLNFNINPSKSEDNLDWTKFFDWDDYSANQHNLGLL